MTIAEKYEKWRPLLLNGDIINVSGTSLLSKAIKWGDNAKWSHSLLCMIDNIDGVPRRLALEAEANGVRPDFLSQVILSGCDDFIILRPLFFQSAKDKAVNGAYNAGEAKIPYDVLALPKILMYKKLGLKSKIMSGYPHKEICSVFTGREYGNRLPLTCYNDIINKQGYLSPQDLIRYFSSKEIELLAVD